MANYSLVIDSKFSPFTYQELLHPVMAATQAHQALETEYGNLESAADLIASKVNETKDPESYKRYTTYYNALKAKADQLSREGLNTTSRRDMLNLKSNFNKQIKPIADAIDRRKELEKEQRTAIAANPTLRYERMAKNMSLDDFVNNPEADYGQSYSGALLMSQVSQAVASYAKTLTKKGKLKGNGLPFQYQQDLQYGASPEQVMQTIIMNSLKGDAEAQRYLNSISDKSDREAIKYLNGVVNQVITSSKIRDWADENTFKELMSFANQGLYSAVGQALIKDYQDSFGMKVAADRIAEARAAARQRAAAGGGGGGGGNDLSPHSRNLVPITGKMDLNKNAKELQGYINQGYIAKDKNGKLYITNRGWRAYNKMYYSKSSGLGTPEETTSYVTNGYDYEKHKNYINRGFKASNSQFNKFIRSFKLTKGNENYGHVSGVNNILNRAYKENGDIYDTYNAMELRLQVSGDQATKMSDAILAGKEGSENQKFHAQIFKPGTGWVDKKLSFTARELSEYYKLVAMAPSRYGMTAIYLPKGSDSKDGNYGDDAIRIKVDSRTVYPAKTNTAISRVSDAYIYNEILRTGLYPKTYPNNPSRILLDRRGRIQYTNKPLDEAGIVKYKNEYNRALGDTQEATMNIGVTSGTPTDDYLIIPDTQLLYTQLP